VLVVGGGNSAGQGALYLARYAEEVHLVIRKESLIETMSAYLIEQLDKTPNVRLRRCTEVIRVEGDGHVQGVTLASVTDGMSATEEADAVFVFIGTKPRSEWLPVSVLRDEKGFVLTGRELMAAEAFPRVWKESRLPFLLETSTPGILAAGDLRAGAMNRVAAAVGEGSMTVRFVHEYLAIS
jgi:thioredoxin reductase (NADPH)